MIQDKLKKTKWEAANHQADLDEPIAIIGMGCIFPGANTIVKYWNNILNGTNYIRKIPEDRWDYTTQYDPSRRNLDKSYSNLGGFVENFNPDPIKFRIPPIAAAAMDRSQFFILDAATQALADAGIMSSKISNERSGVYIGSEGGGASGILYAMRANINHFREALRSTPSFQELSTQQQTILLEDVEFVFKDSLPEYTEDTVSGTSGSLLAGRLCNCLNLRGGGQVINAACASSLAAVDAGVEALRRKDLDLAIAGGVDGCMDIATYVAFCSAGVLSSSGSFPFDERADGMVIGEGAGVLILKRLSDANRDNNRIYSLIRNISFSSDGRSKGITAPDVQGQIRALKRTYKHLPFSPTTVKMIEAHGTGTRVGDQTEFDSLSKFFSQTGAEPQSIWLGSVKASIGHLRAASGVAGLIKTTLALYHKTLPPILNCETPRLELDWDNSPLKLIKACRPWSKRNHPRRAGVDAFGFGGINYHAVLEEAPEDQLPERKIVPQSQKNHPFPAELLIFRATSRSELSEQIRQAQTTLSSADKRTLRDFSNELCHTTKGLSGPTLALVAKDAKHLTDLLAQGLKIVNDETRHELTSAKGIYFGDSAWNSNHQVAFVFPGQGSPYLNMADDLIDCFPCIEDIVNLVDSFAKPATSTSIREVLCCSDAAIRQNDSVLLGKLNDPDFNHPVMLAMAIGLGEILTRAAIRPDMVAGHSLGEYFALRAAGVFDVKTAIDLAMGRGQGIAGCPVKGAMAVVSTSVSAIEPILKKDPGYVVVANKNCHAQTVISGEIDAIERVCSIFENQDISSKRLPVSNGFHSKMLKSCAEPFSHFMEQFKFNSPNIPVQCNLTGRAYLADSNFDEQVRQALVNHLTEPVDFMSNIAAMYDAGTRLFIEVGPGTTLCSFIDNILMDKPHWTIPCNHPKRSPTLQLLHALAFCAARGLPVDTRGIMPAISAGADNLQSATARVDTDTNIAEPEQENTQKAIDKTHMDESVWQQVLKVVSCRSGYPADFIDPDFDIEADLTIDSIKQMAIAVDLSDHFGIELTEKTQKERHRIGTLRALVHTITALRQSKIQPEETVSYRSEASQETKGTKTYNTDCHRWVCKIVEAPLVAETEKRSLHEQRVIILDKETGEAGTGATLKILLEKCGAAVERRLPDENVNRTFYENATMIVNLMNYGVPNKENDDLNVWWQNGCREVETWLTHIRCLIEQIRSASVSHLLWLNVTSLGGTIGSEGVDQGNVLAGIGLSILRSLTHEVPKIKTRFLDLDSSPYPETIASQIIDELQISSPFCCEIGYKRGQRHEIHWQIKDFDNQKCGSDSASPKTILAVGGLRGITAAICRGLSKKSGGHFIILGRSPVLEKDSQGSKSATFEMIREKLLARFRAEGRKVTPAEVNHMAWQQVWQDERLDNLHQIRKNAASVAYYQCDITDGNAVCALLAKLQTEYGNLDLVIQGGGDVISKPLDSIETNQFIKTMRSKALGTASLLKALNQVTVGTFINISSVAGRWNDPGMSAYGAGHEVASLLVAQQRNTRPGRWINIFFGPWTGVGMARLGDAVDRMRINGVNFATETTGVAAFLNELGSDSNESIGFCGYEFAQKNIRKEI